MRCSFWPVILFFFFFFSCSSSNENSDSVKNPLVKTMIIDAVSPTDPDYNFSFTYDGYKLKTVTNNGVLFQQYTYLVDKLIRIDFSDPNAEYGYLKIKYNSSNVPIEYIEYNETNNTARKHVINDNSIVITYTGDLVTQDTYVNKIQYYVQSGNVVTKIITTPEGALTSTNVFSTNGNPFRHISNLYLFKFFNLFIDGNNNNATALNYPINPNTITFTYTIDNKFYVTSEKAFSSEGNLIKTITYTYY